MTCLEWSQYHGNLFGLASEADTQMLGAWALLFEAEGYSPTELRKASDWVAVNDPPRYRSDHLARLSERLRDQRRAAIAKRPVDGDERGTCTTCNGAGRVVAPLVAGMQLISGTIVPDDGVCRTCCILCHCPLGRWYGKLPENGPPKGKSAGTLPPGNGGMMAFEEYQRLNPRWREQMQDRIDAAKRRECAADNATRLDRTLGAIISRAKERQGM